MNLRNRNTPFNHGDYNVFLLSRLAWLGIRVKLLHCQEKQCNPFIAEERVAIWELRGSGGELPRFVPGQPALKEQNLRDIKL